MHSACELQSRGRHTRSVGSGSDVLATSGAVSWRVEALVVVLRLLYSTVLAKDVTVLLSPTRDGHVIVYSSIIIIDAALRAVSSARSTVQSVWRGHLVRAPTSGRTRIATIREGL